MPNSRLTSWFLLAAGLWNWLIWPRFLRAIWADDRSWNDGPTAFFLVHAVLIAVSLAIGTALGWLGVAGLRSRRVDAEAVELRPRIPTS